MGLSLDWALLILGPDVCNHSIDGNMEQKQVDRFTDRAVKKNIFTHATNIVYPIY